VSAWSEAAGDADLARRLVAPLALVSTRIGNTTCAWAAPVVAMPDARTHRLYPEVPAFAGYPEAIAGNIEAGVARRRQSSTNGDLGARYRASTARSIAAATLCLNTPDDRSQNSIAATSTARSITIHV
jgi:hypothetical protein